MQSVLSNIAASDPRQVPVGTFHLAVQAHSYISTSLEKKKHQHDDAGMYDFSGDADVDRAATILSAIRLVPTAGGVGGGGALSHVLGQKRGREEEEEGDVDATQQQQLCYDVSALHSITSGTYHTTLPSPSSRETFRAPIPFSTLDSASSSTWCSGDGGRSSSSTRKWKLSATTQSLRGDITHTFVVPKALANSLLMDEFKTWRDSDHPQSTARVATLYEMIYGQLLHESPVLSAHQMGRILTPALADPLLKTDAGQSVLSHISTSFESAYARRTNEDRSNDNTTTNTTTTSGEGDPPLVAVRDRSTGDFSKSELGAACRKKRLQVKAFLETML